MCNNLPSCTLSLSCPFFPSHYPVTDMSNICSTLIRAPNKINFIPPAALSREKGETHIYQRRMRSTLALFLKRIHSLSNYQKNKHYLLGKPGGFKLDTSDPSEISCFPVAPFSSSTSSFFSFIFSSPPSAIDS